jgi:beta-1,4-mannosyltransferase
VSLSSPLAAAGLAAGCSWRCSATHTDLRPCVRYAESAIPELIKAQANITVRAMPTTKRLPRGNKLLYIAAAPFAALSRALALLAALMRGGRKGVVLLQNPPSIPTLAIVRVYAWLWDGAAVIVDWHNYGYTIMESTGAPHALVRAAQSYERFWGRRAPPPRPARPRAPPRAPPRAL